MPFFEYASTTVFMNNMPENRYRQKKQYTDGETICIWGNEYSLQIIKTAVPDDIFMLFPGTGIFPEALKKRFRHDMSVIELSGSNALLYVPFCHTGKNIKTANFPAGTEMSWEPSFEDRKAAYKTAVYRLFTDKINEILHKWEKKTGLKCKSWHITDVLNYWGQCSSWGKDICFNINLLCRPLIFVEFVVLHELVHVMHMNHGPKFRAIMARYMPDYKIIDKKYNSRIIRVI